jgi:hypothetical protein
LKGTEMTQSERTMKRPIRVFPIIITAGVLLSGYQATTAGPKSQGISLVKAISGLPGSFLGAQSVYADSQRIYLCSFQGDLFVLQRDRQQNFPLIETISIGSPLAAVRGDDTTLYVTGRDGNLYIFSKTWPLQFVQSLPLSNYGLMDLDLANSEVYVAMGQAAMTATADRIYLAELNPGDFTVELSTGRTFGDKPFVASAVSVFDRLTGAQIGTIPNPSTNQVSISTWEGFIYLTNPGCCGLGTYIHDARSLKLVQQLIGNTNTVAGIKRKGVPLLVAGNETGSVDLYGQDKTGYQLINSVNLKALTGFTGVDDIEIRALWVDGIDNLVFAGSSWGNDYTRSPALPSLFVLELP